MLKEQAIEGAKRAAKESGIDIFVVEAPIEVRSANEHEEGPFAFCPENGVVTLFSFGVIVHRVHVSGEVTNIVPPLVVDYSRFDAIKDRETFESL